MKFNKLLESSNITNYKQVIAREAVRAIIIVKNNILLIQSNRGDYKFPGGGVEKNESHFEALVREVREETGYINCVVKDKVGIVIEQKMDEYIKDNLFQMTSHYYFCELTSEKNISLQLDGYESNLQFTPKWVPLQDAIRQNENLFNQLEENSWLKRETFVLKEIGKYLSVMEKI